MRKSPFSGAAGYSRPRLAGECCVQDLLPFGRLVRGEVFRHEDFELLYPLGERFVALQIELAIVVLLQFGRGQVARFVRRLRKARVGPARVVSLPFRERFACHREPDNGKARQHDEGDERRCPDDCSH